MSDAQPELQTAEVQSTQARKQLAGTLAELQSRLNPKALARDAVREVKETGEELARGGIAAARRHPFGVAGAVAAIGLVAARGPILRLFGGGKDETDTVTKR